MHFDRHVAYWARHRAGRPFVTFGGVTMSWGELDRQAGLVAQQLLDYGVAPGDRVGILLNNCLEWCVAFAAAIRVGGITVPLNAKYGTFELNAIARDADCAAILSRPSEMAKLERRATATATDGDAIALYDMRAERETGFAAMLAASRSAPRCDRDDDDALAIAYTSGTTGLPKGIVLTHRAVELMALRVGSRFGWELERERLLILAPLAFTGGIISNLAVQLVIGGSSWLEPGVDPARALSLIVGERLTFLAGVPALWERIATAPGFAEADITSLRTAITGGAPVSMELVRRYADKGVVIRQQFGVSENCGCVFCPDREGAIARPHSCGPALPGVEAEIRDDEGRAVPPGTVGEICIRSPQLMREYWRNPQATSTSLVDGWYLTGDLGWIDECGGLVVADRKKNMLISGGVNIYPAEIERALMTIAGVEEVVVFGQASLAWGQQVTAVIYAPGIGDAGVVLAKARELLGPMKAPKEVLLSSERLPRTSSDKIARSDLDNLYRRVGGRAA